MADLNEFLGNIAQIESAGGKYTNHPVMQHGIHKGDSAIGTYGLMPNTVKELAVNSPIPQVKQLALLSPQQIHQVVSQNPTLERHLAEQLGTKVLANQGGDELRAAYAWNQGHNLPPEKITDDRLMSSPYVQKYFKASGKPAVIDTPNPGLVAAQPAARAAQDAARPTQAELLEYLKSLNTSEPEPEVTLRKEVYPEASESSEDKENDEDPQTAALKQFLGY